MQLIFYKWRMTGDGMGRLIPVIMALLLATGLTATTTKAGVGEAAGQERTWNFVQATIPGAQQAGNWGEGVTVAVVDTWVEFRHPDLKGRIAGHALCINSANGCRDNSDDRDRCVHGTHVAGTVVSGNYGVAPRARVLAVQVLGYDPLRDECSGSTEDVARGIRYAVDNGADVINLSLGTLVPGLFSSEAVAAAVHNAARAGVVVVFAAGNGTVPVSEDYGSDAVLVAATGPDGEIASYSTRGGDVSLAAPGGDDGAAGLNSCSRDTCILSTVPDASYALLEGTSMAAPHVSGVAALLLSQHPERGRPDVLETMQATARPLAGTRDGLIDATAALRQRATTAPTTTTTAVGTSGSNHRATRIRRPSALPSRQEDRTAVDGDIVRSRSVTFPRDTEPARTSRREREAPPGATAAPPDARPERPAGSASGLPLKVLWTGLMAVGVVGAGVAAFGAVERLRRPRRGSW